MVLKMGDNNKKVEDFKQNMATTDYNVTGIPFYNFVNVKDLNFIKGNVIRDLNRAIILKPITREKIVEVMVEEIEEKVICVPRVQVIDKYVEVVKPVIRYKIKEVKRPVTVERIKRVPKIIEEEKILEVPEIQYVEKIVDVPKIVQKEKIIEVPLPMVRERRIPILNVSRKERFQEVEGLEYNFINSKSDLNSNGSFDIESSLSSSPMNFSNQERDKENKNETEEEKGKDQCVQVNRDVHLNEDSFNTEDYSKFINFSSKIANYNSSEGEKEKIEQLSELSANGEGNQDDFDQYPNKNNEIHLGNGNLEDESEFPNMISLTISEKENDHGRNLERCEEICEHEQDIGEMVEDKDQELRKSRFESRVLMDPAIEEELSRKLIENISTQVIPRSLKIVEKKRRQKKKV